MLLLASQFQGYQGKQHLLSVGKTRHKHISGSPKVTSQLVADDGTKPWSPDSWAATASPRACDQGSAFIVSNQLLKSQLVSPNCLLQLVWRTPSSQRCCPRRGKPPVPQPSPSPPSLRSRCTPLPAPAAPHLRSHPGSARGHTSKPPASQKGLFLPPGPSPVALASPFLKQISKIPYLQSEALCTPRAVPTCRYLSDTELPSDLDSQMNTSRFFWELWL